MCRGEGVCREGGRGEGSGRNTPPFDRKLREQYELVALAGIRRRCYGTGLWRRVTVSDVPLSFPKTACKTGRVMS